MSVLINLCETIEDEWTRISDSDSTAGLEQVIVSARRLREDWGSLKHAELRLGVALDEADSIEDIVACLPDVELVVVSFQVFADGRAFSQARLLRDRYGYQGDIRAQGDVIRDQLSFMQRCGINQFKLADGEDVDLALSAFSDISLSYQPELYQSAGC